MKKICIVLCLISFFIAGCNNSASSQSTTTTTTKNYEWVKLSQEVKFIPLGESKTGQNMFFVSTVTFQPLCSDENIESIEYNLENCIGTFMDKNQKDPYANNVQSSSYIREGNNQEDIYFTMYYNFDKYIANKDAVEYVGGLIEKIRIKLKITYNDGNVKERTFAIKLSNQYNYRILDLYELI